MKRLIAFALLLAMALSLCACGGGGDKPASSASTAGSTTTAESTTTTEPATEPEPEPTPEPAPAGKPFEFTIYNKIYVKGIMPDDCEYYDLFDFQKAAKEAKEKGEEYTPPYKFYFSQGQKAVVGDSIKAEFKTHEYYFDGDKTFANFVEYRKTDEQFKRRPILRDIFEVNGREAVIIKGGSDNVFVVFSLDDLGVDYGLQCDVYWEDENLKPEDYLQDNEVFEEFLNNLVVTTTAS